MPSRKSAYRANHSTETAITAVYDEIVRAVDSGDMCALVLLDLSSAFGTVDHETMLYVQYFIDVSASAELRWTGVETTCLTARRLSRQGHSYPDLTTSSVVCPKCPYVLGPKKFIACTEDLANVISQRQLSHHLYADDTQLLKRVCLTDIR